MRAAVCFPCVHLHVKVTSAVPLRVLFQFRFLPSRQPDRRHTHSHTHSHSCICTIQREELRAHVRNFKQTPGRNAEILPHAWRILLCTAQLDAPSLPTKSLAPMEDNQSTAQGCRTHFAPGDNISTAVEITVCHSRHPDIIGHPSPPREGHARSHLMASRLMASRLFAIPQPSHGYVTAEKAALSLCVCLPFECA